MFPYFVIFFLSIFATHKAYRCQSRMERYVHSCIAIIPLVILASFRDPSVGTDTISYIYIYEQARNCMNIWQFISLFPSMEIGFLIYNFVISKIVFSVEGYYMITYSVMILFVYISAFKLKEYISPTVFMFIYLFVFFSESLNIMRQYIAISLTCMGIVNLFVGKSWKYLFWNILACFFHSSAIMSIGVGIGLFMVRRYSISFVLFVYMVVCIAMFFTIGSIESGNLFVDKLSRYSANRRETSISNSYIVIYTCTVFLLMCNYKNNVLFKWMLLILLTSSSLLITPLLSATLYRMTIYFNIMTCFAVSYVYKNSEMANRWSVFVLLGLYLCFYIFSVGISGSGGIVPYKSVLLAM